MSMYPHVVTVFNRYEEDEVEKFQRTVLKGVLYVNDETSSILKTGQLGADAVKVYIPYKVKSESKTYVDDSKFRILLPEERGAHFTFARNDYIALGDVDIGDMSPTVWRNEYGEMHEISGSTDYNFGGLKNWLVIAQ